MIPPYAPSVNDWMRTVAREVNPLLARGRVASLKDDFGATEGADNTVAINKAIAGLNGGEFGVLDLPEGTFPHASALDPITVSGVTLKGEGGRKSILAPVGNVTSLHFTSTSPTTNRISDITLADFGIDQGGVTSPTAGLALRLSRVDRLRVTGLDVRNVFQGVLVEGGADQRWSDIVIASAATWSSVASGSYLLRFKAYPGTAEIPSEVFFDNFNIKGASSGGSNRLENCFIFECGDGLFFSNGHAGFSHASLCHLQAQPDAALSLLNIDFDQVYFDGNMGGDTSGSAFVIDGSTLPTVIGVHLNRCTVKNFNGNGLTANLSTLEDMSIGGNCQFSDIGNYHVKLIGTQQFDISSSIFRNGNGNNNSSDAIVLDTCVSGTVVGNRVMGGTNAHPVGLHIFSPTNITRSANIYAGHTANEVVV